MNYQIKGLVSGKSKQEKYLKNNYNSIFPENIFLVWIFRKFEYFFFILFMNKKPEIGF